MDADARLANMDADRAVMSSISHKLNDSTRLAALRAQRQIRTRVRDTLEPRRPCGMYGALVRRQFFGGWPKT